jgi:hypothetical protein
METVQRFIRTMSNETTYFNKTSLISYIFLSMNLLFFCYLLVFRTSLFHRLLHEDSLIEYLGFFFLLLTGVFLLYSGFIHLKNTGSSKGLALVFLTAGILFLWAAGEEISWGQRIFSIETPEALSAMNYQGELNIHNINKRLFQQGFRHLTTALVFFSAIAFFLKKERVFGVLIPDTLLVYAFLLMPAYTSYREIIPEYHLGQITLLFYLLYFIRKGDKKMMAATITAIATIVFVFIVHLNFNHLFQSNNTAEVREYLFSFACLTYSLILLKDARQLPQIKNSETSH